MAKKSILILAFLAPGALMAWHAWDKSMTYDEVFHAPCGYYHWKHLDFARGLEHPPLLRLWAGLPLQFLGLEDPENHYDFFRDKPLSNRMEQVYGTSLIYQNRAQPRVILFASRAMMVLLSLGLIALVAAASRRWYGPEGGCLSFFLTATFPLLLGHGSIVTTDVGGAAAATLALLLLAAACEVPSSRNLLLAGAALGLAQACKLSNVFLIPVFGFCILFYPGLAAKGWRDRIAALSVVVVLTVSVLNAAYAFQDSIPPHPLHPRDLEAYGWSGLTRFLYRWAPLPDFYLKSLGFMTYHVRSGFSTFFLGEVRPQGVWYYFPVLFLLRTPTLALALVAAMLFSFWKAPMQKRELVVLLALSVFTLSALRSKLNLGLRHFLLVYPLLFLLAGRLGPRLQPLRKKPVLVALLAGLHLAECFHSAPHLLAFFNWPSGGPSRGMVYSSDLDYGQDLRTLGKFLKSHPGAEVVLSYFGTALPEAEGIFAEEILPTGAIVRSERVNSPQPAQEFLAVSVSHLQGHMTGRDTFAWLREKKPAALLGYSIAVYDITRDPQSRIRLEEIRGHDQ